MNIVLGSVWLSDERRLSGIGIHRQLSGGQSEELTVATRPHNCRSQILDIWQLFDC